MKDTKDYGYIGIIIMFVFVLIEILLIMFGSSLNNPFLVNILLIAIPLGICCGFLLVYRKNHLRHIYTEDELKSQHKDNI